MQTNANAEISIIRSSRLVETGGYLIPIYIIFLHVCLCIWVFVTSFLALAKNAIGVASGEPGKARKRKRRSQSMKSFAK